ncbi:MAG: PAQR family membrane homeostasis protein TrhA [Christensenellales bacterium]
MEETAKHRVPIPHYTLTEELINAISHGIGALFGVTALVLCLQSSIQGGNIWAIFSSFVYGITLTVLYTISTIYHALKVNKAKRVFRVIDHCSIFLLIAGTYTPYALVALQGTGGWILLAAVWLAAITGVVCNAVDIKKFRVFSMISYLSMGWIAVFAFNPLAKAIGPGGFWFLVSGGIIYTAGTIFYGFGRSVKYMHAVFHFFVLAGSILHFLSIYLYVL